MWVYNNGLVPIFLLLMKRSSFHDCVQSSHFPPIPMSCQWNTTLFFRSFSLSIRGIWTASVKHMHFHTRTLTHTKNAPPHLCWPLLHLPQGLWGEAAWHQTVIQTLRQIHNRSETERVSEWDREQLINHWLTAVLILRDSYDKLTADEVAKSLMRVNQAYYVQEGKGWKIVRFDVKDNPSWANSK